jgi:lycopene cyclase domain-containing protein
MTLSSPYLFLELAILVFMLGFGWEQWRLSELCSGWYLLPAVCLACFWFAIDQIALRLNLWTFPVSETSTFRLLSLPVEEYVLFFLHTLVCLIFLRHYSQEG